MEKIIKLYENLLNLAYIKGTLFHVHYWDDPILNTIINCPQIKLLV